MIKIIDNYLNEKDFNFVHSTLNDEQFLWEWRKVANHNSKNYGEDFQFMHFFIEYGKTFYINASQLPITIVQRYAKDENKKFRISRAKANLFIKTSEQPKQLGYHKDITDSEKFLTVILYLETSNGYTEFKDGTRIDSIKNRAVIFPAHIEHQTVTQTDTLFRTNINVNIEETC